MGNTFAYDVKGDKSYNISAEKIQELYEQIRHVDDSMCGFVKTLDSLRAACELFLRHCDKRHDKLNESQDGWETVLTDEELAINLMKTLEESVNDQKRPAVESLTKLMNYLIDSGTDMTDELKSDYKVLSLDMYLSKEREEKKVIENTSFTDGRIESLRKQLKLEKELNKTYIKDIEHLEERNKLTQNERDIAREGKTQMEERLQRLEKEYSQIETEYESLKIKLQEVSAENIVYERRKSMHQTEANTSTVSSKLLAYKLIDTVEINALKNERDNLKIEKDHLETALNCLKDKQYVQVQVVVGNDAKVLTPTEDVLAKIKAKIKSPTSLLYVMKVDIKDIKQDIPVLFFCDDHDCRQFGATLTLSKFGMKKKDNVALVAIHIYTSPSAMKENDCIQKSSSFKNLGGVFNVLYSYSYKFYECDMNERNIRGITNFVEAKGFRKSVLEVHDLQ